MTTELPGHDARTITVKSTVDVSAIINLSLDAAPQMPPLLRAAQGHLKKVSGAHWRRLRHRQRTSEPTAIIGFRGGRLVCEVIQAQNPSLTVSVQP